MEAGAIFSADLLKKRCELTPEMVSRLEGLFFQLEENPSADAVFKATTTILRNATLRAIQKAVSSKGQVDAEALVQATAGRSPLGLPTQALADFGKVLQVSATALRAELRDLPGYLQRDRNGGCSLSLGT